MYVCICMYIYMYMLFTFIQLYIYDIFVDTRGYIFLWIHTDVQVYIDIFIDICLALDFTYIVGSPPGFPGALLHSNSTVCEVSLIPDEWRARMTQELAYLMGSG